MTTTLIFDAFICGLAIFAAVLEGNGAVYFFNKMPAQWLCDYGQRPSEELRNPTEQRVRSMPWKYIFTMFFVVINIKLVIDDIQFSVPASFVIWILLELSIADKKYKILPDQLIILLSVCSLGFIPYRDGVYDILLGGATGFALMVLIALIGKVTYRRDTIGGGDIKLFTAIGFICGSFGVILIFAATAVFSATHMVYLLLRRRIKRTDYLPMAPYISIATGVYLLFFWGMSIKI